MTIETKELRSAIEAILLVSGEPVSMESLTDVFPDEPKENIERELQEMEREFAEKIGGFFLEQAAGGFRFVTRPDFDIYLRKYFAKQNEGRLSVAALETLAMIAYRQPITAPEIGDIRGVNSAGVLRTLLDRKMIRIAGRKNVVGSPFLYRTTREFLLHFGLNSIQDLPKLEEFAEVLGENLTEEMMLGAPTSDEDGEGLSVELSSSGHSNISEAEIVSTNEASRPSIDEAVIENLQERQVDADAGDEQPVESSFKTNES
ncbi:MAG TPA: SMC-Scp complex subunit ScpB [Thermoanaerobaculia bacterium]|nr:SMC-Scp complex subunit ScpB [Thermoanaerobaculia bacterium]